MKLLKRFLLLLLLLAALCTVAAAADYTAADIDEFCAIVFDRLKVQDTYFSIEYNGTTRLPTTDDGLFSFAMLTRLMSANTPNPDGTGPDTHMLNIKDVRCTKANTTLAITIEYLQSPEQIAWVDAKADEIIASLQLDGLDDYTKIKKIYEFMGTAFTYDHTLTKFSDYEGLTTGTMVCQGYALLTYRLMWKAGIPCRIIVGFSANQNHGWNIVKLDGKWYNLDTTWDSKTEEAPMFWKYFLRAKSDFSTHNYDKRFESEYFLQNHPMAETSYEVPKLEIFIGDVLYSGLTIRKGRTTQLQAVPTPESTAPVKWSTTDEAVVSVTDTGLIESLSPGAVYITATSEDPKYIPGQFAVTAVDLSTCSDWADEELNSYYMRKLYPAAMCSDYQSPITREEFAGLLYQLLTQYHSTSGTYHYPGFEDVTESPYWYSIVYTSARGLFDGTADKTFSPTMELTREQAAKILCDLLDFMEIPFSVTAETVFTDADTISTWATDYVARAAGAGLLLGDGETFRPLDLITREEAGVMLERLFVNLVEPNIPAEEAPAA